MGPGRVLDGGLRLRGVSSRTKIGRKRLTPLAIRFLLFLLQFTAYQDDLAKRVGPIVFAGEATEMVHAWIDTAIKSGVRAAEELHSGTDWTLNRGVKYNEKQVLYSVLT